MDHEMSVSILKPMLYNLLMEAANQGKPGDTVMNQNMGVNLSNAVKKDGVNVIQLQNYNMSTIMPLVIDILKTVDSLDHYYTPMVIDINKPKELAYSRDEGRDGTVRSYCESMYLNGFDYRRAADELKVAYMDYLIGELGTTNEAARFAKISTAAYYQTRKRLKDCDGEERIKYEPAKASDI